MLVGFAVAVESMSGPCAAVISFRIEACDFNREKNNAKRRREAVAGTDADDAPRSMICR
jgi:hypothetical protein